MKLVIIPVVIFISSLIICDCIFTTASNSFIFSAGLWPCVSQSEFFSWCDCLRTVCGYSKVRGPSLWRRIRILARERALPPATTRLWTLDEMVLLPSSTFWWKIERETHASIVRCLSYLVATLLSHTLLRDKYSEEIYFISRKFLTREQQWLDSKFLRR